MNTGLSDSDMLEIMRRQLRLDRSRHTIIASLQESIESTSDQNSSVLRECESFPVEIYPERFFIAQEFNENQSAFRKAVEDALRKLGFASIRADDHYWADHILCKILAYIVGTPLGVYQLTATQNRNVCLELGIALGLRKPYILVKDRSAEVPSILKGIEYYEINSYLETAYELGNKVEQYVAGISKYSPVQKPITKREDTVVIAHGNQEPIDNTFAIAQQLAQRGYQCLIIGGYNNKIAQYLDQANIHYGFLETLEEIINGVIGARFGVYRVGMQADPDAFVALGVAISRNRPRLLVNNARDSIPSDLQGFRPLTFQGYIDLGNKLEVYLDPWLDKHGLRT